MVKKYEREKIMHKAREDEFSFVGNAERYAL
jgi:hypothetical protein